MYLNCSVKPALARADGSLRLDHDKGDAVDEQNEVSPLLGGPCAVRVLVCDGVLVSLGIGEVDEVNGDVLAFRTEGHRALAGEPGGELLVGLHEAVAADAYQDCTELVEDVVGTVRLARDFRVQPDQSLTQ